MTPRIVSFLPAATEMAFALGLGDSVIGVSHECDYPSTVKTLPRLTRNVLPVTDMTQSEIDAAVAARLRAGDSLYDIDAAGLTALAPDLVITQDLCEVCAPSTNDLAAVLREMRTPPRVLGFAPKSLDGIFQNLRALAQEAGCEARAETLIAEARRRMARVAEAVRGKPRPRVFCLEWLDPPYCSGHWVPEMIEIAGGIDELSRKGADSVRISWDAVRAWAPEVLIVMPCGFTLEDGVRQAEMLPALPGWRDLPAVRDQRVYAVDANAFFARPGPRVVDGIELLAQVFHPACAWPATISGTVQLRTKDCSACGSAFLCLPAAGCWCESVPVPEGTLRNLCTTYADCLCAPCLKSKVDA